MPSPHDRPRVALLCSEPMRPTMAGIGIRYLEFARHLPRRGIDVVVLSPATAAEAAPLDLPCHRTISPGRLAKQVADCRAVIAQGSQSNGLLGQVRAIPICIDLYDPFLVEHFLYHQTLGPRIYRNDHATFAYQLARADLILCSSEEQKLFYAGFLAALKRVSPSLFATDPDLDRLMAVVPFGVPHPPPPHRPVLPPKPTAGPRVLFGGLYDWYDPWTTLEAMAGLERTDWDLLFVRNPNTKTTPQGLAAEVEAWAKARGLWESRVRFIDWTPADRRFDLLRDVDALVATHRPTLETRLSMRTRFLEAMAVGCPVVTSQGGALARLIETHGAGLAAAPGDAATITRHLTRLGTDADFRARQTTAAQALAETLAWDRVVDRLVPFCTDPWRTPKAPGWRSGPLVPAVLNRLRGTKRRLLGQV